MYYQQEELNKINWGVLDLSETRTQIEEYIVLNSGAHFENTGNDYTGVGFIRGLYSKKD